MNINEVISNLASLASGEELGSHQPLHPNDVNTATETTTQNNPTDDDDDDDWNNVQYNNNSKTENIDEIATWLNLAQNSEVWQNLEEDYVRGT